jgi:hypothetical protein
VQTYEHREQNLRLSGVHHIIKVTEPDPTNAIAKLINRIGKDNLVFVRGDDWVDFPGKQLLVEFGIEIRYIKYTKGISSTQIRDSL